MSSTIDGKISIYNSIFNADKATIGLIVDPENNYLVKFCLLKVS